MSDAPLPVAVLGATGRMGRLVVAEILAAPDLRLVAAVSRSAPTADDGWPRRVLGPEAFADARVVIDFSLPAALDEALPHLGDRALVTGTTGLDASGLARRDLHAARAPLLAAANFSLGVNLLLDLVRRASAALPEADVEVVETHHRAKIDAPSGTALALGSAVDAGRRSASAVVHGRQGRTGPRAPGEIGFHALRGGDVVGEHTVWFLADGERVSLSHGASSRVTFARGAVRAARWLAGRPAGMYSLAQVLGLGPDLR